MRLRSIAFTRSIRLAFPSHTCVLVYLAVRGLPVVLRSMLIRLVGTFGIWRDSFLFRFEPASTIS